MSFPRYPKYKPSGVEWLGDVPAHWEVKRSRRLFALRDERARPHDRQLTASQEHGIVYQDDFITREGRRVVQVIKGADILKHVEPNDFVISMRSFEGGIEYSSLSGCISSAYVMLVPGIGVECGFYKFALKCRSYIQALQSTSNLVRDGQALRYANFVQVDLPLPPSPEQRAIAAFLDRETAKIDGLVAEQQRLIELLKEKRQAVISHAVTKGLDPKAPMKPSGVEWLGDVPAHWVTRKLTLAFHTIGSGTTPRSDNLAYYEPGEIPWVNTGDLTDGELSSCERLVSRMAIDDYPSLRVYPAGSLLVAMYGATTGKLGLLGFDATVNQACCAFVGNDLVRTRFLFYWLLGYRAQLLSLASGGGQPNISQEVLRGLRVATPTPTEQDRIIEHLLHACDGADALIAEAQSAIALLQERRSALISAAVTGQIDVRNAVATEAA